MCHNSCPVLFRLLRHHPTAALPQLGSHRWPAVSRCRAMDAEREGRISLPMLACHAAAASQPPNLENAATPRLQPTCSTPPAGRDPPRSFVRAQLQRRGAMLEILAPHSTDLGPPHDLSSHALDPAFVTRHHPRHKHARHSQLGFVFASRATLCSATGQRLSIVSTNWPIRPEDHLSKLVLAAGSGRLPVSVGPGCLTGLTSRGANFRHAIHVAVPQWFTPEQLNTCSHRKEGCSLIHLPTSM